MRIPQMVSPSALARFEKDREEYYLSYMAEPHPPRSPQSQAAAVGSAFDAIVKSALMNRLFGTHPTAGLQEVIESQVEEQYRQWAVEAGQYVFESYLHSGAFAELLALMQNAKEDPQFEFNANIEIDGVPIAGKPDCRFVHSSGTHVILDWKVNGFCSKSASSPSKGYAIVRDGLHWPKPSKNNLKAHSLYEPFGFNGIEVNKFYMEQVSIDWADQLSMYAWMTGEEPGSENMIVCIEQAVCKPEDNRIFPLIRFASHKARVSAAYQLGLVKRLKLMWQAITSGHVFYEIPVEESLAKCQEIDKRAFSMLSDGTAEGDFFAKAARGTPMYRAR